MTDDSSDMPAFDPSSAHWRTSTFSSGADCVAVAPVQGGWVAVRDSKCPDSGTLLLTRAEMGAWLAGVKAGEFDDLAGLERPS